MTAGRDRPRQIDPAVVDVYYPAVWLPVTAALAEVSALLSVILVTDVDSTFVSVCSSD